MRGVLPRRRSPRAAGKAPLAPGNRLRVDAGCWLAASCLLFVLPGCWLAAGWLLFSAAVVVVVLLLLLFLVLLGRLLLTSFYLTSP